MGNLPCEHVRWISVGGTWLGGIWSWPRYQTRHLLLHFFSSSQILSNSCLQMEQQLWELSPQTSSSQAPCESCNEPDGSFFLTFWLRGAGGSACTVHLKGPDVLDVLLFFCAFVTSSWVWHALLLLFCFSSTTGCGSETLASDFSVRMFLLTKGATSALEESIRELYPSAQRCAANGLVSKMICIAGGWTKVTFEVSGSKAKLKFNQTLLRSTVLYNVAQGRCSANCTSNTADWSYWIDQ